MSWCWSGSCASAAAPRPVSPWGRPASGSLGVGDVGRGLVLPLMGVTLTAEARRAQRAPPHDAWNRRAITVELLWAATGRAAAHVVHDGRLGSQGDTSNGPAPRPRPTSPTQDCWKPATMVNGSAPRDATGALQHQDMPGRQRSPSQDCAAWPVAVARGTRRSDVRSACGRCVIQPVSDRRRIITAQGHLGNGCGHAPMAVERMRRATRRVRGVPDREEPVRSVSPADLRAAGGARSAGGSVRHGLIELGGVQAVAGPCKRLGFSLIPRAPVDRRRRLVRTRVRGCNDVTAIGTGGRRGHPWTDPVIERIPSRRCGRGAGRRS